jgi:protein arginine kinase activator
VNCEKCGENEATIRYTEYRDGQATRFMICRSCASNLGFTETAADSAAESADETEQIELSSLNLVGYPSVPEGERCPACGLTVREFRERTRFGCPRCYELFQPALDTLFQRVHGATRHRGRLPGGAVVRMVPVGELRARLENAVANEDFEEAARLRDLIRRAGAEEEADS